MEKKKRAKKIDITQISSDKYTSIMERVMGYVQKNQWIGMGVMVGISACVLGLAGYKKYRAGKEESAIHEIWTSEAHLRKGDQLLEANNQGYIEEYERALQGGGGELGLFGIIKQYGGTKSGNLARFYVATIYFKQKNYAEALKYLNSFHGQKTFMVPRAWCMIGDIYAEQKQYPMALTYYYKAVEYESSKFSTPAYLMKAACVHEVIGEYAKALTCYERICTLYPSSEKYGEACKHASRVKVAYGL